MEERGSAQLSKLSAEKSQFPVGDRMSQPITKHWQQQDAIVSSGSNLSIQQACKFWFIGFPEPCYRHSLFTTKTMLPV